MGYNTDFTGELKFTRDLTGPELAKLKSYLQEDCRKHPEWERAEGLYYVDLTITEGMDGLEWDGAEKTYDLEKIVNMVIWNMRKHVPDFGLTGMLSAQGEDATDRWELRMEDGVAMRHKLPAPDDLVTCPHCGKAFSPKESE